MDVGPTGVAALAYVATWLSGLLVISLEKRNDFVRFNAMQSIVLGFASMGLYFVTMVLHPVLAGLVGLVAFVLFVAAIYKTHHGEWFVIPVVGPFAMDQALSAGGRARRSRGQATEGPSERTTPRDDRPSRRDERRSDRPDDRGVESERSSHRSRQ